MHNQQNFHPDSIRNRWI